MASISSHNDACKCSELWDATKEVSKCQGTFHTCICQRVLTGSSDGNKVDICRSVQHECVCVKHGPNRCWAEQERHQCICCSGFDICVCFVHYTRCHLHMSVTEENARRRRMI